MGAIDFILQNVDKSYLKEKKKQLISPRGSIINGKIQQSMNLQKKVTSIFADSEEDTSEEEVQIATEIRGISMVGGKHGFIFNAKGTDKIMTKLSSSVNNELRLYDDFCEDLLFSNERNTELWLESNKQRSVMAKNIQAMMKETDVQYRTHGSRLHYLTIGKVSFDYTKGYKTERMDFPLLMFECEGDRSYIEKHLCIGVEKSGFINFVLDERMLDGELAKINKGNTIALDGDLPAKLSEMQAKIEKMRFRDIDNLEIDPTYSRIGVITGFETEYLDPVWGKIL